MIEVLPKIVVHLCHSDLRRLRFVNHKFCSLVEAYQAQFNKGLTALPNEIILDVIQYLGAQDQSRLARVSHRFYTIIMDTILGDNIRHERSSLLHFSVKKDLKRLTRTIVYRGGDLNTTVGHSRRSAVLPRPLSIAAYHGYESMVKLLLELGAPSSGHGKDMPLAFAISKRHERIALILLQSTNSIRENSYITGGKLLQMACAAKMVTLVSCLLERRSELHSREVDTALYHVLLGDISKEDIIKRAFHHEVFQIVLMLLRNGASPDVRPSGKVVPKLLTARLLSSRHPDPRVRALLLDTVDVLSPKRFNKLDSQVGRSWVRLSEVEDSVPEPSYPPDSYVDQLLFARLGDFLGKPKGEEALAIEDQDVAIDQHAHGEGIRDEEDASIAFDLETILGKIRLQRVSDGSSTADPCPGDAFPQLGSSKNTAQHQFQEIWGNFDPSVHSSYSPPISAPIARSLASSTSRKSPSPTEPFPQLTRPSQDPNNIERSMWVDFLKGQSYREIKAVECTPLGKDEGDANESSIKSKKKKAKWVPLTI